MIPRLSAFLTLVATLTAFAADSGYDEAVARGKALIEARNYPAAMQELKTAVAADSARHQAYFQLAVASYRAEDLTAAEEYAKASLSRAPEAETAAIREVLGVIGEKQKFVRLEQEGNEAFSRGLMAKAADSFRQAYELFPNRGAVGLRAATIYADSLSRLVDAAVLWQKIVTSDDADSANVAREELKRRNTELNNLAATRLAAAKQAKNKVELVRLTQAFPTHLDLRLETAAAYAVAGDVPNTAKQLGEANKLGLKPAAVISRTEFQALLASPQNGAAFGSFVQDAYGEDVAASLRAEKQKADAAVALAARQAKEAADRAARQAAEQAEAKRRADAEASRLAAEREERARRQREEAYRNAQRSNYPAPPPAPPIRRSSDIILPGMR